MGPRLPAEGGSYDAVNFKGPRAEIRGGFMFSDWFVLSGRGGCGIYTSSSIGIDTQSGQHIDLASGSATALTEAKKLTSRSLALTLEFELTRTFNLTSTFRVDSRSGVPAASSWNVGLGMPIQIGRSYDDPVTVKTQRRTDIPGVVDLGRSGQ